METKDVDAAFKIVRVVADTIRDMSHDALLGGVPSGVLYAVCASHLTLDQYQSIIDLLKHGKLVEERNHLLSWIGPTKGAAQ